MSAFPDPVWPVLVLAFVQLGDGILCIGPVDFVRRCFEGVNWPRHLWWVMPPLKFAAAAGLVAGIWIPYLGTVTAVALVAYFVIAIGMHLRARDIGRTLFVNATGMFVLCSATVVYSYTL